MKKLIPILLLLFAVKTNAQTANAGVDQTIVLPTNSVTVGGASSATSYLWSKITDVTQPQEEVPTDPATISSPTSATTTITGLIQGVWYYRIGATTGATTVYDTVVIRVNYYAAPTNTTTIQTANLAAMAPQINARNLSGSYSDTSMYWGIGGCKTYTFGVSGGTSVACPVSWDQYNLVPFGTNSAYVFRDLPQMMMIDSSRGKLHLSVRDGLGGYNGSGGFMALQGQNVTANHLDSNYTYILEQKGYFANDIKNLANWSTGKSVNFIQEIHGTDGNSPPIQLAYIPDSLMADENFSNGNGNNGSPSNGILTDNFFGVIPIDSFYLKTHTVRIVIHEGSGYPGQVAFVKVEIDGKVVYFRNNGQVGQTFQLDYPVTGFLYDYNEVMANTTNTTRGRQVTNVLEAWNAYKVTGANAAPTANAGSNQTLGSGTTTATLTGTGWDEDGYIASYAWSKTSGAACTISSPSSASTGITGLSAGTYTFQLTTTDNQGATGTSTMTVTVASGVLPVNITKVTFHKKVIVGNAP